MNCNPLEPSQARRLRQYEGLGSVAGPRKGQLLERQENRKRAKEKEKELLQKVLTRPSKGGEEGPKARAMTTHRQSIKNKMARVSIRGCAALVTAEC